MPQEQEILIAMGANLPSEAGSPAQTLQAALSEIAGSGLTVRQVSRFFETPCFPEGAGPDYVNACALLEGAFFPRDVLAILHRIEAHFGRERECRWGSRSLDLDLLAIGEIVLPDATEQAEWRRLALEEQMTRSPERLILPHPRLQERAFVLVPLCDVAPDWVHPLLGQSVQALCDALPASQRAEVKPL